MNEKISFILAMILLIIMFFININNTISYEYMEKVHHIECDDEYIITTNQNVNVSFINCTKEYNYWVCECNQSDVYMQRNWGNISIKLSIDYYKGIMIPENHKNDIVDIDIYDIPHKRENIEKENNMYIYLTMIMIAFILLIVVILYINYKKIIKDDNR